MNETKVNNTYTDANKLDEIKKYNYLREIAYDCLNDIRNGGQCCVYTKNLLRVMLKISPDLIVEWNSRDGCYYCYK